MINGKKPIYSLIVCHNKITVMHIGKIRVMIDQVTSRSKVVSEHSLSAQASVFRQFPFLIQLVMMWALLKNPFLAQ